MFDDHQLLECFTNGQQWRIDSFYIGEMDSFRQLQSPAPPYRADRRIDNHSVTISSEKTLHLLLLRLVVVVLLAYLLCPMQWTCSLLLVTACVRPSSSSLQHNMTRTFVSSRRRRRRYELLAKVFAHPSTSADGRRVGIDPATTVDPPPLTDCCARQWPERTENQFLHQKSISNPLIVG